MTEQFSTINETDGKYKPQKRILVERTIGQIYLPSGKPGLSCIFDIIPAFDPPEEPWWALAAGDYPADGPTPVYWRPGPKFPPDAALTFDVFTEGTDESSRERIRKVTANMLILANIQVDPEAAQRLLHPAPLDESLDESPSPPSAAPAGSEVWRI